jgi:hypothetical protein
MNHPCRLDGCHSGRREAGKLDEAYKVFAMARMTWIIPPATRIRVYMGLRCRVGASRFLVLENA